MKWYSNRRAWWWPVLLLIGLSFSALAAIRCSKQWLLPVKLPYRNHITTVNTWTANGLYRVPCPYPQFSIHVSHASASMTLLRLVQIYRSRPEHGDHMGPPWAMQMWSQVVFGDTEPITLKYRIFCQEYFVFDDRWSFMAVVSRDRIYCTCTVKPVLRDNCHERAPVLTDPTVSADGLAFQYTIDITEPVTRDQATCLVGPHFVANALYAVVFHDRFYCSSKLHWWIQVPVVNVLRQSNVYE